MTTLFVEIFRIYKTNAVSTCLFLRVLLIFASASAVTKRNEDDSHSDYYEYDATELSAPSYQAESAENLDQDASYETNDKFSNSMVVDDDDEQPARNFVSEHETPRQVPVKVKIHGDLATPAPDSGIQLNFVPKQTYYQVRRYDTQLHLPKSAAYAEAQTAEELMNAPRLREVVSHKKTQEVYEEQGYEDAAYDHGGYKKAGQHHEIVKFPGEQKTDYTKTVDQSTEQAEMIKIGRSDNFTTAQSSHVNEPQHSGTGTASARQTATRERNRNRKPKTRASWSRPRAISTANAKENKNVSHVDHTVVDRVQRANSSRTQPSTRRRRVKTNSTDANTESSTIKAKGTRPVDDDDDDDDDVVDTKMGEESKIHSTLESTNELDVQPTTYRPPVPAKFLTKLRTGAKQTERQRQRQRQRSQYTARPVGIAKIPATLVDSSGYKFENPFENVAQLDGAKFLSHSFPYEYKSPTKTTPVPYNDVAVRASVHVKPLHQKDASPSVSSDLYRDFKIKFKPTAFAGPAQPNKMAFTLLPPPPPAPYEPLLKSKFDKNTKTKFRGNVKSFPYEIVDADNTNAATDDKKKYAKRNKFNDFPYQIVENVDDDTKTPSPPEYAKYRSQMYNADETNRRRNHVSEEAAVAAVAAVAAAATTAAAAAAAATTTTDNNDSPWIPITPKEVYDIHGYDRKSPTPSEIKVKESRHSIEATAGQRKKEPRMPPIRVFDHTASKGGPHAVSTSYSIRHVYPKPAYKTKRPSTFEDPPFPFPANLFDKQALHNTDHFQSSTYHFEFPDVTDSLKWKQFGTTSAVQWLPSKSVPLDKDGAWPAGFTTSSFELDGSADGSNALSNNIFSQHGVSAQDTKDIETLSSNRYSVFQPPLNYTSPMQPQQQQQQRRRQQQLQTTTGVYQTNGGGDPEKSLSTLSERLLFRHPHLSRETSHLDHAAPPFEQPTTNSTSKRDLIFTNVKNNKTNDYNFASNAATGQQFTKASKRNDVKPDKIVVYPLDYTASASFVEKLTLAHYADAKNVANQPSSSSSDYHDRMNTVTSHLRNGTATVRRKRGVPPGRDHFERENENEEEEEEAEEEKEENDDDDNKDRRRGERLLKILLDGTTTEIAVDTDKYPFYSDVPSAGLAKYSVLRYISNPERIPRKNASGRMTFYESTDHVRCPEPVAPRNVVPRRQNGEWAYDTRPKTPRIHNLGDSILCLKMKFFGSDPLDNPFFKEDSIGYPLVFPAKPRGRRFVAQNHVSSRPDAVREWIDSLARATPFVSSSNHKSSKSLRKRSAKIGGTDQNGKRIVHKVHLAGGFINISNNSSGNVSQRASDSHVKTNSSFNASSEAPALTTTPPNDRPPLGQFADLPRLRIAYGLRTMGKFLTRANRTNISRGVKDAENSTTTEAYGSVTTTFVLPSPPPSSKGAKKADRVDGSTINVAKFQHEYKEPSWRTKKREPPEKTPSADNKLSSLPNPDIDSLLYVIHPKTGQGKWMKMLKVEELRHNFDSSGNSSTSNLLQYADLATNADSVRPYNDTRNPPCQHQLTHHDGRHNHKQIKIEKPADYDVYHISGLLKQVAPLKASQVEINNLQTTEEHVQDVSGDNDEANSYYDFEDEFIHTPAFPTDPIKFPQPHERSYYYVVDDDNGDGDDDDNNNNDNDDDDGGSHQR